MAAPPPPATAPLDANTLTVIQRLDDKRKREKAWRDRLSPEEKAQRKSALRANWEAKKALYNQQRRDRLLKDKEQLAKQNIVVVRGRPPVARMAALPDTADYGRLTVMLAAHCTVEWLFDVGPGSFRPPPRVHSSIVRLVPHTEAPFAVPDPARFAAVVAAAFSQRRKTLRNSVAGLISPAAFEITGIDPKRRAETLSPSEFADLAATPSPLYFDPNALETV